LFPGVATNHFAFLDPGQAWISHQSLRPHKKPQNYLKVNQKQNYESHFHGDKNLSSEWSVGGYYYLNNSSKH
jgi:hypothetical protein